MYARHFALSKDAFSIAPDPRFLYMSERHREALAHLLFGVTGTGGFVLFTGNIGTGKTTVCRCFLEQIPPGCNVAMVFNPKLSVLELLQTICEEFHIAAQVSDSSSLKSYVDALNVYLLESHAKGQSNVLIIDEAQNLLPEVLEQLRLLTNLETYERKLLQIVLIGQPELRNMLDRPELEQLAQRVIARYHLESLNPAEASEYIQHRLTVAGHSGPLPFDDRALRRIHTLTGGVPRRINLLCGRVLLGAWANGLHRVDQPMVEKAAAEVFGEDPAYRLWSSRSHTAWVLGLVGVLCLVGALAMKLWPHPLAKDLVAAPAREPVAQVSTTVAVAPGPAPVPTPVAVTLSAPASAAAVPAPKPIEDMGALLSEASPDIASAWRELGRLWSLDPSSGDPCQTAAARGLQCYRTVDMTIPLLRQLARPGVLALQQGSEPAVFAALTGLSEQTATLSLRGQSHRVTLISLARFWRGDYATYWTPPAGYSAGLRDGDSSSVYGHLSRQLAQLEGKPPSTESGSARMLDASLVARVKAFQRGQGIKADGHPGPMTWMQIDKALALDAPSLEAETP
jgi:general secretion pathway protein A